MILKLNLLRCKASMEITTEYQLWTSTVGIPGSREIDCKLEFSQNNLTQKSNILANKSMI